jgi:protease I
MIVSPENNRVRAGSDVRDGDLAVDVSLGSAEESGFDALLLPGGEKSVERLAGNEAALAIIRAFLTGDRPVGAISQSLQLLIRADGVSGRRVPAMLHCATNYQKLERNGWISRFSSIAI